VPLLAITLAIARDYSTLLAPLLVPLLAITCAITRDYSLLLTTSLVPLLVPLLAITRHYSRLLDITRAITRTSGRIFLILLLLNLKSSRANASNRE
jgi:hypothetical protein